MNTFIGILILGSILAFIALSIRAIKSFEKDRHNHKPTH